VRTDRRHDRRALTIEELRRLLAAAQTGPERFGIGGAERALVYRLAVESGLRANELRSLTRGSFDLDTEEPAVTVEAAYSKRRRADQLPLRPETAALLGQHLANKLPTAKAFNFPRKEDTAEMLRADLAAARAKWISEATEPAERAERDRSSMLAYRDHAGLVADFHSLRHTFISNLARAGVHPKLAQSLARHSDINLTMSRYTHTTRGEQHEALAALPDLTLPDSGLLLASGTTDAAGSTVSSVAVYVALSGAESVSSMHRSALATSVDGIGQERKKRRENRDSRDGSRRLDEIPRAGFEPTTPGLGNRCSIL
jgi:integrase